MSKKTVEMSLQKSLLWYLEKDYLALVSIIKTVWKDETINLGDTILQVIRHAEINKKNKKNSADVFNAKVLAANFIGHLKEPVQQKNAWNKVSQLKTPIVARFYT